MQAELSNSVRQPSPYKPTIVFVYVGLNTISQINLPEKTYNIAAEVVLEWQDGRLGFTPNSKEKNALLKFNGDDVNSILRKIWSPSFAIGNEIQPREIQNRSVSIAPNGWVRVYEQFNDVVKFDADVHTFPFCDETLTLAIDSALDDRSNVTFDLQEFKFTSSNPSKQVIGRWSIKNIDAHTQVLNRLDSKLGFPEIVISIDVKHIPQYIIFNFFLPLFIIFVAAAAVTFIDPSKVASYSSPRLGGTITLILTTIALKLSLSKEIPAVNYITLTDAVFGVTVLTLLLSLITSCTIIFLLNEKKQEVLAKRIHVTFRKIYPFLFVGCLGSTVLFFFSVNWKA
ncbi:hypothetical protein [Nostoc sp. LEGE 12450]|uniref:hypothetical protein n=1 Tax=Nostoc sp. LEGE 12450 TaxID=1828643 RepID=UPI00187DE6C6|nr:hypothetical protein [Nostoc sp. LEGE 12450]MBE8985823.1 hypothetical protein [Nostoc sp. LEGE 12450]